MAPRNTGRPFIQGIPVRMGTPGHSGRSESDQLGKPSRPKRHRRLRKPPRTFAFRCLGVSAIAMSSKGPILGEFRAPREQELKRGAVLGIRRDR